MGKKGFTIIEILTASLLAFIVSGAVLASFNSNWKAEGYQETVAQLQQVSRQSVDSISTEARQATSVVSSLTSGGTTYTTGSSVLILQLSSIDANQNVLTAVDYLVFRLNPSNTKQLQKITVADSSSARSNDRTPSVLNSDASAVSFRYYNNAQTELLPGTNDLSQATSINLTVTSSRSINSQNVSRQFGTTVSLRNTSL